MSKIIDCFSYFNEDTVLDLRLNILNEVVDKFVILESKETHQGNNKKLNFDINNFKKFSHKIEYNVLEKITVPKDYKPSKPCSYGHYRDQCQRNFLQECTSHFSDEDWIMISDLDEIPDPEKIMNYNLEKKKIGIFLMDMFYYKLNLKAVDIEWSGTKICKKKNLISPQWLRERSHKRGFFKTIFNIDNVGIKDGGWHFTYLNTPENISYKLKNFAHAEENIELQTDIKNIQINIQNKKDVFFERNLKLKKINISFLPNYIQKNSNKLSKWII